ncbi:GNAT family N-acetyltransferase [Aspergillus lucknowensis]|uniref:N-acetyltransferase domain-containing protein n=1 Tax=Aspergillus lucknowensis TaxID=176173 RepID=A0ABR4LZ01_9EURO
MTSQTQKKDNVVLVPKHDLSPEALKIIAEKYKAIRLAGLQSDPDAFGSSYAREIQFTEQTWVDRVLNPLGMLFIALQEDETSPVTDDNNNNDDTVGRLLNNTWLGQAIIIGPIRFPTGDGEDAARAKEVPWELLNVDLLEAAKVDIPPGSRVVYTLVGMYVRPEGRRAANGQRLAEKAVRAVQEDCRRRGVSGLVFLLAAKGNEGAKRLYERVGFVARGKTVVFGEEELWMLEMEVEGLSE